MTRHRTTEALLVAGLLSLLACSPTASGQSVSVSYSSGPPVAAQVPATLTLDQLEQLLGPIALYPDALVSQVLPASTYPDEVVSAEAWLQTNPAPSQESINLGPWEPSVKVLLHYPAVLQMMADSADWTQALGTAFAYQPQDVMTGIQDLRQKAIAAGTLYSTPEQQVQITDNIVYILPAQQQTLYVPAYDPTVVYVRGAPRSSLSFVLSYAIGGWLDNDCDWDDRVVIVGGGWHWGWRFGDDHRWQRDENRGYYQQSGGRGVGSRSQGPAVRAWTRNDTRPRPMMPAALTRRSGVQDNRGWSQTGPTPAHAVANRNAGPATPGLTPGAGSGGRRGPLPLPAPAAQPSRPQTRPGVAPVQPQPANHAVGDYQSRIQTQQAQQRGYTSRTPAAVPTATRPATPASAPVAALVTPAPPVRNVAPPAVKPAAPVRETPQARQAPPVPTRAPAPARQAPQVREAPAARAPAPAARSAPAPSRPAASRPAIEPSTGGDAKAESARGRQSKGR